MQQHKRPRKQMGGKRFGRLLILDLYRYGTDCFEWLARCDCGNEKWVDGGNLRKGSINSCGCLRRKHGQAAAGNGRTTTYGSWLSMRERCLNTNSRSYPSYGGRGISICERWSDFNDFVADMGLRPPGCSLDRIDVDGNYEPGNCRWATAAQQAVNRSDTVRLTYDGKTMCVAEWAREIDMNLGTLWRRLRLGWSTEKALSTPVKENARA